MIQTKRFEELDEMNIFLEKYKLKIKYIDFKVDNFDKGSYILIYSCGISEEIK